MLDITSSNSIVAIRLKEAITEKGLKQTSIANRAGYTAQELNDMLNGRRIMRAADISSILSLISERDMDTMAEKDKDEAVNELNGNSVGYLGYQK